MFFDEPLTGLDPLGIRRMKDSIVRRARAGAAIVLSSHLLHLLKEVCTHVLILKKGEKIADGTLAEVVAQFSQGEATSAWRTSSSARPADPRLKPRCRALLYLRLVSLRNWLAAAAARLRQPKYLAGALVGAAYLYFFLAAAHDRLLATGVIPRGPTPVLRKISFYALAPAIAQVFVTGWGGGRVSHIPVAPGILLDFAAGAAGSAVHRGGNRLPFSRPCIRGAG